MAGAEGEAGDPAVQGVGQHGVPSHTSGSLVLNLNGNTRAEGFVLESQLLEQKIWPWGDDR